MLRKPKLAPNRARAPRRGFAKEGDWMTVSKQDMDAALARLTEAFPQTFVLEKYRPHRPLKIGIAADIRARCPTITRRTLAIALSIYARRVMYLQGLVTGAARVDLDGNPVGEVTAGEAEHAATRLAGIMASREARRVAAGKPKLEPRVPCVGKTNDVSVTEASVKTNCFCYSRYCRVSAGKPANRKWRWG